MTSGGCGHTPSTGGRGKEKVDYTNRRRRSSATQDSLPVPETQFSPYVSGDMGSSDFEYGNTSSMIPDDSQRPSSNSPNSSDENVDHEEVLYDDGRVRIVPAGSAFLPSKPSSKAITAVIKEKFQRPWTSWGQIKEVKEDADMMFSHFKEKCTWDPYCEERIRQNFHHRAGRRLSDMLLDVRTSGKRPHWMGGNVFKALVAYWNSEEYKKIRSRNKTNRASEKGGTLHTGGSINTAQIRERMEKKVGRPVGIHELHKKVHIRKGTGEFVEERARLVQEQFEQAMSQYQSQIQGSGESLPPTGDVSQVQLRKWVEVSGGKHKGRVYGAGVLSSCYRKGISHLDINAASSSSSAASTGRSYTVEEYAEMQRKVSELEHECHESKKGQEVLQENYGTLQANYQTIQAKMQQMEKQQRQLIELLQQQAVRPMVPPYAQPQGIYYGPPPQHVPLGPQPTPQHLHSQPIHYGGIWPTTPITQYQQSQPQQGIFRPHPVQPQPHIQVQEPHPGQGTTQSQGIPMADLFGDMDVSGFINPHPDGQAEASSDNEDTADYYSNRRGA